MSTEMSTRTFAYLTTTEVEWLEYTYDTMRRRLLVPSVEEMINHFYQSYESREMAHREAGIMREVGEEIKQVILEIQAKERG